MRDPTEKRYKKYSCLLLKWSDFDFIQDHDMCLDI